MILNYICEQETDDERLDQIGWDERHRIRDAKFRGRVSVSY